ncbi:hypothetical protein KIPB_012995, partial [Kipferlia bialata]
GQTLLTVGSVKEGPSNRMATLTFTSKDVIEAATEEVVFSHPISRIQYQPEGPEDTADSVIMAIASDSLYLVNKTENGSSIIARYDPPPARVSLSIPPPT